MATLPVRAAGIAWFSREDYPMILDIMADAHTLPATYEKWRERAEAAERNLTSQGHIVVRAIIEPDKFPGWCAERGLNVDSEGRTKYASWIAFAQIKQTH